MVHPAATRRRPSQVTISSGAKATIATGLSSPAGVALSADELSIYVAESTWNGGSVTQVGAEWGSGHQGGESGRHSVVGGRGGRWWGVVAGRW